MNSDTVTKCTPIQTGEKKGKDYCVLFGGRGKGNMERKYATAGDADVGDGVSGGTGGWLYGMYEGKGTGVSADG